MIKVKKLQYLPLISAMSAFLVMGFVDFIGTVKIHVEDDLNISPALSNFLPSMIFIWFLIFSVPSGMLMSKIGRKRTVLFSLLLTSISMIIPIIHYSIFSIILTFVILGIGNTMLQVSLNPMLTNIVGESRLSSTMTFGRMLKAVTGFFAPIIASWAAIYFGNWRYLFPIFLGLSMLVTLFIFISPIEGGGPKEKRSSYREVFGLLRNRVIFMSFLGILCHVGVDIGVNITAPELMQERFGLPINTAVYATSFYLVFRIIGSLIGGLFLTKVHSRTIFIISISAMAAAFICLFFLQSMTAFFICLAIIGLGNTNCVPIITYKTMRYMPRRKNEISSLMVTGISGGALFPPIIGFAADFTGSQSGGLLVIFVGVLYLLYFAFKMKN